MALRGMEMAELPIGMVTYCYLFGKLGLGQHAFRIPLSDFPWTLLQPFGKQEVDFSFIIH